MNCCVGERVIERPFNVHVFNDSMRSTGVGSIIEIKEVWISAKGDVESDRISG